MFGWLTDIRFAFLSLQEDETICTDEEAHMAQQIASQLTGALYFYSTQKSRNQTPVATNPSVQAPKMPCDLEQWLEYMCIFMVSDPVWEAYDNLLLHLL